MSVKKSKLDLLVRVRYSNPLPPPPCPPKLLDIPTNPLRYTRPEFLNELANDTPLPMIVDAEMGMPLDLSQFECLWDENMDDSALNPDPNNLPPLDPKDQFLLDNAPGTFTSNGFSTSASGTSTPTIVPNVTWLRKTEYLTRDSDSSMRVGSTQEAKQAEVAIDVSRFAQLQTIESSFAATDNFDLTSLKHPNKPGVSAVDSYEIFPDAELWANAYDLFRFSERPGERPPDVEDPRLDCAILRPMESDGDHFLAYYLTKEDEAAVRFKEERLARDPSAPEEEPTPFHFARDYEVVKVEQEVPNEFLLMIHDGEDEDIKDDDLFGKPKPLRPKAAYYKNIERKMVLKKKRVDQFDTYHDKWHVVKVTHVPMSKEEEDEREEVLAEVMDPMYLLGRADMDAEGEVETEDHATSRPENGIAGFVDAVDVFGE